MFYGRTEQLEHFAALWRKQVPSLVVCRGRRRIGKSTLVKEFARRSGGLYLKLEGLAPDKRMTNRKLSADISRAAESALTQAAAIEKFLLSLMGRPFIRKKLYGSRKLQLTRIITIRVSSLH